MAAVWFGIVGFYAGFGFAAGYQWLCNAIPRDKGWVLPIVLFPSAGCWFAALFIAPSEAAVSGFMVAALAGLGIGSTYADAGFPRRRDR